MRIEIAGVQVTDAVVDVLETLQNRPDVARVYIETLDELTRIVVLDISTIEEENDTRTLARVRTLQMLRRDLITLATPPDVDSNDNDTPTATF